MTLTDAIKKNINDQLDSILSEINLEGEVNKLMDPIALKLALEMGIKKHIEQQVALKLSERIHAAIHKRVPLIDAVIENKVVALMLGFTDYIEKLDRDSTANANQKRGKA